MPVTLPPVEALAEYLGATTRHIRRIEIYEADGSTRWGKDKIVRLKDGSVTVDYDRDERRALDLTLTNDDGVLKNAPGEFWYDKVIKVFRGVRINQPKRLPRILALQDKTGTFALANSFRQASVALGYGDVQVNELAADYATDISPYDIIVGLGNASPAQITLLKNAYMAGKSVLVQDADAARFLQASFATTATTTVGASVMKPLEEITHPVAHGWTQFTPNNKATQTVYTVNSSHQTVIAPVYNNTKYARVSAFSEPTQGGRAVVYSFPVDEGQYKVDNFALLMLASLDWLNMTKPLAAWEVQIGEFMIDRITESNFPYEMKITGRDYAKKCLGSKYVEATQFAAGQKLETLIGAIATGAGITKRLLPATGVVVTQAFFFDRGTSRWEAMKEIATAYNYEIFFDATGFLVIRPFRDPTTTQPTLVIRTGEEGQIASYTKSTSDTSLFNHVLVSGESSDADTIPVWAEAKNTKPNSPTSIAKIGDRYWEYTSPFIETTAQAQQLANTYLSIHQLEEFELSFESLFIPWLEVGDILGWEDPRPATGDPHTFLLSSLSLPLKLGPMSGVAKRVTIVG